MKTLYLNFHNVVSGKIETDHPWPLSFFESEYQTHRVDLMPGDLPMIRLVYHLRIFPFAAAPRKGYIRHIHKGLAQWAYRVNVSDQQVEIEVYGNRFAVPMVHHMMLHPSLRYLAAQRNVLLLHAGSVTYRGKSLIFTGRGGTGKTTTTSLILANGGPDWGLHADDYTFIAPGSQSFSYQTRSHLYRDLLNWVPEFFSRLTPMERLQLEFYGKLRVWSGSRILWPVRLPFHRLWPDRTLQTQAKPAAVILLARTPAPKPLLTSVAADQSLVNELIEMNFWEARHFLALLEKSSSVDSGWVDAWRAKERELLMDRLDEIPIYRLELPQQSTPFETFREDLLEILRQLTA
jgi:hypothetical protein